MKVTVLASIYYTRQLQSEGLAMRKAIASVVVALMLSDCASVTRGTSEQVQMNSIPPGAEAQTSLGFTCVTPCIVQAPRNANFGVMFSKRGYRRVQVLVRTHVSGAGAGAFAGNILLGGAIGMVGDAMTGAGLDHCPNPIVVTLRPGQANEAAEVLDPCKQEFVQPAEKPAYTGQ
jgi:hypothetical protein